MSNKNALKIYFGEIMRELFDVGTPLYLRVNVTNPHLLLEELNRYLEITKGTGYLQLDHIKALVEEYLYRAKKDYVFKEKIKDFSEFNDFLTRRIIMKELKEDSRDKDIIFLIEELENRIKPIIRYLNKSYFHENIRLIKELLIQSETKIEPKDFTTLKKLSISFSTEIIRFGYSKFYIYEQIIKLLINDDEKEELFLEQFNKNTYTYTVFVKIICKNPDIKQIFKSHYGDGQVIDNFDDSYSSLLKALPNINGIDKVIASFLRMERGQEDSLFWIKQEVTSIDYIEAAHQVTKNLYVLLDEIKFEYTTANITIFHHGACFIDDVCYLPQISESLHVHRKNSSPEFFASRNKQIQEIYTSKVIDDATKEKLKTLFRFYRHFLDSDTMEHKFINLWIGWEHVFSLSLKKEAHTWKNIYSFFPKIYALSSLERVLRDMIQVQFYRNCRTMHQKKSTKLDINTCLSDNPKYQVTNLYKIIKEKTTEWNNLLGVDFLKNDDLTKVKLFRLHEKLKDPKKYTQNSKSKIEWTLFRLYRVRNAIVHKGNIKNLDLPIEILTSELEHYYKIFIDIAIERFSVNERFENFEQFFLSFDKTFDLFIKEDGISKISEASDIKKRIINPPLVF